jgi:hypothetical protein
MHASTRNSSYQGPAHGYHCSPWPPLYCHMHRRVAIQIPPVQLSSTPSQTITDAMSTHRRAVHCIYPLPHSNATRHAEPTREGGGGAHTAKTHRKGAAREMCCCQQRSGHG